MSETKTNTTPTYREILLHLTEVSAMNYKDLPEGVIRHYGTRMVYQTFLTSVMVKPPFPSKPKYARWLRLESDRIGVRFGGQNIRIPNNGNGVDKLVANCLKLDPILLAFTVESFARRVIDDDGVTSKELPALILIKLPPEWLGADGNPWARLEEAGAEMDRRTDTNECFNEESDYAMRRRVLTAMLDRYEPKAEATS